jgi:putative hydrolase of the HAD superfamily
LKIQAVFFDLGHTLLYFDADWAEIDAQAFGVLTKSLRSAGCMVDEVEFPRLFATALSEYYRQRDTEFIEHTRYYVLQNLLEKQGISPLPEDQMRQVLKDMYTVSQDHWQLEEDARATLEFLRKSQYKLGLISNAGDDEDVQNLVDRFELRKYFDMIVTSAALGWRKPHPRIFQEALSMLNVQPLEAVMVGDMLGADIMGARNAGISSIWITRRSDQRYANLAHEDTITPDATIASLEALPCALTALEDRLTP